MVNKQIIKSSYVPLQPGFEKGNSYYIENSQRYNNTNSTILYYQFKTNKGLKNSLSVIPDGCFDILFCCDNKSPFAYIYGSVDEYKKIEFKSDTEYFGLRLLPGNLEKGSKCSLKELINTYIPLDEMLSIDFSLVEKIFCGETFSQRIKLINELIGTSQLISNHPNKLNYALNMIYRSKGNIRIKALTDDIGCSERYFRTQFEKYIGMSPKSFSQIVKFQSSLFMLKNPHRYAISDVMDEVGYYDQAHFINTFKSFGYITPTQFIGMYSNKSMNSQIIDHITITQS